MKTILFICTGNTCRSPMAEAICRHLMSGKDDFFIASAGVAAFDGAMPSLETMETLDRMGIPHEGQSSCLTAEMIRKATLVLGMTTSHVRAARALVEDDPKASSKIQPLDPDGELPDPIGMGQSTYDSLGERLMSLIPERLEALLNSEDEQP